MKKTKVSSSNDNEKDTKAEIEEIIAINNEVSETRNLRDIFRDVPVHEFQNIILDEEEWLNEICMDKIINVMKRNSHFDFLSVQYLLYLDLIEGQFSISTSKLLAKECFNTGLYQLYQKTISQSTNKRFCFRLCHSAARSQ